MTIEDLSDNELVQRGEMLTVACDLGEIPPQSPGKLYEALLNANWAYRGAAGAVHPRHLGPQFRIHQ